jgi:hypothetical protein
VTKGFKNNHSSTLFIDYKFNLTVFEKSQPVVPPTVFTAIYIFACCKNVHTSLMPVAPFCTVALVTPDMSALLKMHNKYSVFWLDRVVSPGV